MAAYICSKPSGSCNTCGHFRFDEGREAYSCFAQKDVLKEPSFEDYKKAIKDGNIELAQEMYKKIFKE